MVQVSVRCLPEKGNIGKSQMVTFIWKQITNVEPEIEKNLIGPDVFPNGKYLANVGNHMLPKECLTPKE